MKKVSLLSTVIIISVMLAGCVKWNTNVNVHSDGTADLTQVVGLAKQIANNPEIMGDNQVLPDNKKSQLEKQGYAVQKFTDDKYVGYKLNKHFNSVEDLLKTNLIKDNKDQQVDVKVTVDKGLFKNVTSMKGTIMLSMKNDNSSNDLGSGMASAILSNAELQFSVTLPNKAVANNADNVNGNTYEWNLQMNKKKEVALSVETPNRTNIIITIAVSVIVILALIGILISRRKQKSNFNKSF
jgi:hypothetical protein